MCGVTLGHSHASSTTESPPRDEVNYSMRAERGRRKREREPLKHSSNRNTVASAHRLLLKVWVSVCVCRDVREQMLHYSRNKSHVIINTSSHTWQFGTAANIQNSLWAVHSPLLTNATHFLQNRSSLNQSVRTRLDSERPLLLSKSNSWIRNSVSFP